MKIVIDGNITLFDPPKELELVLKRALALPNPTYYQQIKRFPNSRHYLSPFIPYYVQGKDAQGTAFLQLPRGVEERLDNYLSGAGSPYTKEDRRVDQPGKIGPFTVELRDYQKGIVEALAAHTHGVVRLDTGFGKTILALKLAEKLQQRTLIIVPTLNILNQFYETNKKFGSSPLGIIQGKQSIFQDITVATIQTLGKRLDKNREQERREINSFGAAIVDECHLFVSRKRQQVLGSIPAKFRFGFTATDRRTDQQGEAINFIFGPKRIDRTIPRQVPNVRRVFFTPQLSGLTYSELIDAQVENFTRNALIIRTIQEQIQGGRNTLVLTKRVKHYELIQGGFKDKAKAISGPIRVLTSQEKANKRLATISQLHSTRAYCLLGTFSLLGTGLDLPNLDTLIIAGDLKSDVLTEQAAGRILRLFKDKQDPLIIDLVDTGHPILKRQANLRAKFYNQMGWKIL